MGDTSNKAKQKWNAAHYTQVKIYADPKLASKFKKACAAASVSMASVISQLMQTYCNTATPNNIVPDYSTRRKRQTAVNRYTRQLLLIKDAEESYMAKIPENLQGSLVHERAEQAVSILDEAVDLLESAY